MRKILTLMCCSAFLFAAPAAFAKSKKRGDLKKAAPAATEAAKSSKKQTADEGASAGYGMAGCGLGSLVFKEQKGPIQIVAGLLNATGGQTFAVTTGTSNCKPDMYNFSRNAQLFITVNKEMLAKDISRGNGETIESLSQIMGCSDVGMLGGKLQRSYDAIFPSQNTSADDASRSILNLIRADGELARNCAKIS